MSKRMRCLIMVLVFNFILITTTYAEKDFNSDIKVMGIESNIPLDKIWTIKFNKNVDENSIHSNSIYIIDKGNNNVKIPLDYKLEGSSVKIRPKQNYLSNNNYEIFIKNITSKGEYLKENVKYIFKTKKESLSSVELRRKQYLDELKILKDEMNKSEQVYLSMLEWGNADLAFELYIQASDTYHHKRMEYLEWEKSLPPTINEKGEGLLYQVELLEGKVFVQIDTRKYEYAGDIDNIKEFEGNRVTYETQTVNDIEFIYDIKLK